MEEETQSLEKEQSLVVASPRFVVRLAVRQARNQFFRSFSGNIRGSSFRRISKIGLLNYQYAMADATMVLSSDASLVRRRSL